MSEKIYKGKILYNPAGKAGEYAKWAANMFVGCSNNCNYCYCKKGVLSSQMGGTNVKLKCQKNFGNDPDLAIEQLRKELEKNKENVIRDGGVFFSFSTDPCLDDTFRYHEKAIMQTMEMGIPVSVLTKCTNWIKTEKGYGMISKGVDSGLLAVGFTLTGHDELEPGASTNIARIDAMNFINSIGGLTFASIEPIVDFESSYLMIRLSAHFCNLFRIGLMSGTRKDYYDTQELLNFVDNVHKTCEGVCKIYWKNSIRERIDDYFSEFHSSSNCFRTYPKICVTSEYNIFQR